MLVLNGKKIKYGILGVFAICMISAITFSTKQKSADYIDTVSLPVSGKVVVIDSGHGKPDERCRSWGWNDRSTNKFKNCFKIAKFIRTKWMYCNTHTL